MKTKMLSLLMAIGGAAYAQHDHQAHAAHAQEKSAASFKDEKLNVAYGHYAHLKDALVASDADEAKKASVELKTALASVANASKAAAEADKISAAADLKAQRLAFSLLSNEMSSLVKSAKLSSGAVYLDYCPMANGHTGAFWLSNEKAIKNPYFGSSMLSCGSVKETIQ